MRIACLLGPGFEDSEFQKPYDEFKRAGHDVVVIGTEAGQELKGAKGKVTYKTERGIKNVQTSEFDALLIPGGHSPDKLRANTDVVDFTKAMMTENKPVFAICHGPQLLLTAGEFKSHKMTAWTTVRGDLEKAGAMVEDKEVVVDKNLVTSRQPEDIPAFVRESLALLSGGTQNAEAQRVAR